MEEVCHYSGLWRFKRLHQSLYLLLVNEDAISQLFLPACLCSAFMDSYPPNTQTQLNSFFRRCFHHDVLSQQESNSYRCQHAWHSKSRGCSLLQIEWSAPSLCWSRDLKTVNLSTVSHFLKKWDSCQECMQIISESWSNSETLGDVR